MKYLLCVITLAVSFSASAVTVEHSFEVAPLSEKEETAMHLAANNFIQDTLNNLDQLSEEEKNQAIRKLSEQNQVLIEEYQAREQNAERPTRAVVGKLYPLPILASGIEVEAPNLVKIFGAHAKAQIYIAGVKFIDPSDMSSHYKFSLVYMYGGGLTTTIHKEKLNVKVNMPLVGNIEVNAEDGSENLALKLEDLSGLYGGAGFGGSIGPAGAQWMIYRNLSGNIRFRMPTIGAGFDRAPLFGKAEGLYIDFANTEHQGYWSAVGQTANTLGSLLDRSEK